MDLHDNELLKENLLAYRDLLSHHIKKEDEILYPWMDKQLTEAQVFDMAVEFAEADNLSGISEKKYAILIRDLEQLLP